MVLSSEEYRTINELRTDEYRNYLPFDLHNQSQIFRQQRPGFVAGPLSLVTWARGKSGQHRALRSRK